MTIRCQIVLVEDLLPHYHQTRSELLASAFGKTLTANTSIIKSLLVFTVTDLTGVEHSARSFDNLESAIAWYNSI